jgi:hypothetical protein
MRNILSRGFELGFYAMLHAYNLQLLVWSLEELN